jgi:single-strand DNA-binding protein
MVTVVGNVATAPVFRELPSGTVARFRMAATARRRDRETGQWTDGHTNFFTIWAWRSLGANVAASLSVGEPVIVQGRLKVRQDDRGAGQQWMSADIDAVAVGHDLSRGTTAFRRTLRTDGASPDARPAQSGAPSSDPEDEGRPDVSWERPEQGEWSVPAQWPAEGEERPAKGEAAGRDGGTGADRGAGEGAGQGGGKDGAEPGRPTRQRAPEPATAAAAP